MTLTPLIWHRPQQAQTGPIETMCFAIEEHPDASGAVYAVYRVGVTFYAGGPNVQDDDKAKLTSINEAKAHIETIRPNTISFEIERREVAPMRHRHIAELRAQLSKANRPEDRAWLERKIGEALREAPRVTREREANP